MGHRNIVGAKPKRVDNESVVACPVLSQAQRLRANIVMLLPNIEIICPNVMVVNANKPVGRFFMIVPPLNFLTIIIPPNQILTNRGVLSVVRSGANDVPWE
jgi:hypothetical protein